MDWSAAIILKDQFSATLGKLQTEAEQGAAALGQIGTAGGQAADKLAGGLSGVAGLVAGGFAALKLGEAVADLTRIGATAETVETIFQNLTRTYGVNSEALMAGLQAASRGTMDLVSLTQTANRALLAGGAELANSLPRLFEIARAAALASGDDINYVYETLVKGIIRGSPLLIDNAGIYIKVGSAVDDYAAKMGVATDELDSHGKMLATLNAVLQEGGEFMAATGTEAETAADKVQAVAASWTNLKAAAGKLVLHIGVDTGGLDWLNWFLDLMKGGADRMADPLTPLLDQLKAADEKFGRATAERTAARQDLDQARTSPNFALTREASVAYYEQQLANAKAAEAQAYAEYQVADAAYAAAAAQKQGAAGAQAQGAAAATAKDILADYTAALDELKQKASTVGDLAKLTFNLEGATLPEMPKVTGPLLAIDTAGIDRYLTAVGALGPAEQAAAEATRQQNDTVRQAQYAYLATQVTLDDNREALHNLATATLGAGAGVLDLVDKFDKLPPEVQAAAVQCGLLTEAVNLLRDAAAAPITIDVRVDALTSAQGDVDRMALQLLDAGWSPEKVRAWRDQTQSDLESHWLQIGETDQFGLDLEMETLLGGYEGQVDAARDKNRQIEQDADRHASEMKRKAEELRSSAESALMRGSTPTELDWLQTKAGTYEDAPLEAARRLDAVAQRGFDELKAHPDWAGLLKIPPEILAGSNDQLKAWAMQTAGNVRDLTRPDLIDWDAFTREFQEQENAKQQKENTINLAVSKLSAAGVMGGDKAKIADEVRAMFGDADPAAALTGKLQGADIGGKLLGTFQTDIAKNKAGFDATGGNLGSMIAEAVNAGVKKGVGNLRRSIAEAVAPEVADILAKRKHGGELP